MRDEVLEFLRQNQGGFVSGQDMSEACHVSRTAIWKHIKALRQKRLQNRILYQERISTIGGT